mmetsp:Transcript_21652/g.40747  ORF Transcript_21652/g.40747 Transcript_21652/m.40747 type:complete len:490 (-) Transcript_21652:156-1625(-)
MLRGLEGRYQGREEEPVCDQKGCDEDAERSHHEGVQQLAGVRVRREAQQSDAAEVRQEDAEPEDDSVFQELGGVLVLEEASEVLGVQGIQQAWEQGTVGRMEYLGVRLARSKVERASRYGAALCLGDGAPGRIGEAGGSGRKEESRTKGHSKASQFHLGEHLERMDRVREADQTRAHGHHEVRLQDEAQARRHVHGNVGRILRQEELLEAHPEKAVRGQVRQAHARRIRHLEGGHQGAGQKRGDHQEVRAENEEPAFDEHILEVVRLRSRAAGEQDHRDEVRQEDAEPERLQVLPPLDPLLQPAHQNQETHEEVPGGEEDDPAQRRAAEVGEDRRTGGGVPEGERALRPNRRDAKEDRGLRGRGDKGGERRTEGEGQEPGGEQCGDQQAYQLVDVPRRRWRRRRRDGNGNWRKRARNAALGNQERRRRRGLRRLLPPNQLRRDEGRHELAKHDEHPREAVPVGGRCGAPDSQVGAQHGRTEAQEGELLH